MNLIFNVKYIKAYLFTYIYYKRGGGGYKNKENSWFLFKKRRTLLTSLFHKSLCINKIYRVFAPLKAYYSRKESLNPMKTFNIKVIDIQKLLQVNTT